MEERRGPPKGARFLLQSSTVDGEVVSYISKGTKQPKVSRHL